MFYNEHHWFAMVLIELWTFFFQQIVQWVQRQQKLGNPVTSRVIVKSLVYVMAKEKADEKIKRRCKFNEITIYQVC